MGSLLGSVRQRSIMLLAIFVWSAAVYAIDVDICASFNTADMGRNVSIYQTNGLCQNFCLQKNQAYAITQRNSCWCSDYTPTKSSQVDSSSCNLPCPAWPNENCGGPNLFGYILLNSVVPSGTKGEPEPSSTSQAGKESRTESSTTSTTSETPESSKLLATSIVQTVTAGGTIQTVTIMPTPPVVSNASHDFSNYDLGKSKLTTGGVVGIVIGIIVGVLLLAGAALFIYFQRKKRHDDDFQDDPSVRGSSSGMLGGRPEMSGTPGSPGSTGNRSSMLQIDPRMDPFKQGLYARSRSHESINTLRDDHDYSRRIQQPKVLRAMNPDPTDD
ncbi:hypothetical protein HIM_07546 [Hirsutella minnesotensis 3608]|uniref:WSC domain-containing protein n=1 Tax=Hirsutella minnesotensis 3608 TaxID=1043627 RepID=A0A0F8A452_9HYPO|nr:hypothetical protein HIM_07546 [Hirsutella minnesotensis 3608]